MSFVLTEELHVKRIAFLDILKQEAGEEVEDEEERFANDFALMTGELARLLEGINAERREMTKVAIDEARTLLGRAAASARERVAAQLALADLPLPAFLNDAVVPYETDEVTRLILDTHDVAAFASFSHLTVGGLRDALLAGGYELARVTENTRYQVDSLLAEMAAIRAQGFACDREEHAIGLHCVAACIFDEHATPLAAISVSGPMARIPEDRLLALGALVRRTADDITLQMGGQLPR